MGETRDENIRGEREVGKKGREIKEGTVLTGSLVSQHCRKKVGWRMEVVMH